MIDRRKTLSRRMLNYWAAHFLRCEALVALLGLGSFVIWDQCRGKPVVDCLLYANRAPVYGALATIFGSLLGFTITAVSILVSFAPTASFDALSKSKHYPTLWATYKSGIRALALATMATIVALVLDRDAHPIRLALYAVIGTLLFAFVRLARCVWILEQVINLVTSLKRESDKTP